jgi:hypothetical protein
MVRTYRLLTAIVALVGMVAVVGPAFAKAHNHHSGAEMLGSKIKSNGEQVIDKVGEHTVAVQVTNGKVAGLHVKHSKEGDVPVKKYKTNKKLAQADGLQYASLTFAQYQDLGTTYIGYSFIDEYGNEQIYWFPYEMILDGDTGAVAYVPLS